jgi:hypothetical protein
LLTEPEQLTAYAVDPVAPPVGKVTFKVVFASP